MSVQRTPMATIKIKENYSVVNEKSILLNDDSDPDLNFYNDFSIKCNSFNVSEALSHLATKQSEFSLLCFNIRSLSKNFNDFKTMLAGLNYNFHIICLTETWCQSFEIAQNSNFNIPGYKTIHQPRARGIGGGVCFFIHNSLNFKVVDKLSINDTDCESLSIEIINKDTRNIIITNMYRPPNGNYQPFKDHLKNLLSHYENKEIYLTGDMNLNLFNYDTNSHVRDLLNTLLQNNILPTINQATRVTKVSATCIDNIFTNAHYGSHNESGIIKTDITDHFSIFLTTKSQLLDKNSKVCSVFKRQINNNTLAKFYNRLSELNWELLNDCNNANDAYDLFLRMFLQQYEKAFPKTETKVKTKSIQSPWMTTALLKSSEKKQRLYEKFLKNKTCKNEKKYKDYKNMFENLKKQAKKNYYIDRFKESTGNARKKHGI